MNSRLYHIFTPMPHDYTILGNGSWATALIKILTDNGSNIAWWMRNSDAINHINSHHHNPDYLSSVELHMNAIQTYEDINLAISQSANTLFAIPSAFLVDTLAHIAPESLEGKSIISAVKGLIPEHGLFLNEYLNDKIQYKNYQFITGPCHAEEVAQEKLSYLTVCSADLQQAELLSSDLNTSYIKSIFGPDVMGAQMSSALKNIYALGAGIMHGLGYGDNFMSVYTTNCFAEASRYTHLYFDVKNPNINSSAYLGDLLVTCYSLHSRNRMFGNLIGQGYSVKTAKIEMGMVAEGYYATKALFGREDTEDSILPIAHIIYAMLWEGLPPKKGAKKLTQMFQ